MDATKQEQLLRVLRYANDPVPGVKLAASMSVSTRTVRNYVREINAAANAEVVLASHRGYAIDLNQLSVWEASRRDAPRAETPMQRLYYILRRLITVPDGEDIYRLAEMLYVSDATIEADLAKVRTLVREFGLTLRRHQSRVVVEGTERDKRKLVRQILLDSTHGVAAVGLAAALREYHEYDVPAVITLIREVLSEHGLAVQEYALSDLALHVVIAIDRVARGYVREASAAPELPAAIEDAAADLALILERRFRVELPPAERKDLARLVGARAFPDLEPELALADDPTLALVRQIMEELSDFYLLDSDDPSFAANLALHVQHMVQRARSEHPARNPLGASFKQSHPLVHELAVFVGSRIEKATGVHVNEDEIAFLSLHLGTHLHKRLSSTDQVTVVCVVPDYYDTVRAFSDQVARLLNDSAILLKTISTLDFDWASIDADVVVTTVKLGAEVQGDVVEVSPILTRVEQDLIADAVRHARSRKIASRIRWTMSELLDPRLFWHIQGGTQRQVIEMMCERLEVEGVTHYDFVHDVLERERMSPTAFGGALAVPHSMKMDARRTAIAVLVSDEPIEWSGSMVRLVVLFALSPNGRHVFRDVLDEFIAAVAEPSRIASLIRSSTTYEDFVSALFDITGR